MADTASTADLEPAARALRGLLPAVTDDRLTNPTPCAGWTVGDLLDHLLGLTVAFRMAAAKAPDPAPGGPAEPSAVNLPASWREDLSERLDALVAAWRDPAAWTGETAVGGANLPGAIMGVVALNELTLHGWDLARGTDQPFEPDPRTVEAVHGLVSHQASDDGTPGLFGPQLRPDPDAPLFDRVLALAGRDPDWKG
ncbi:TIGR03086 family metal-binding protein [Solwaraspora sp. WMMD1047]|uniref:TIGR03086 family metal-binding protein n=1 Tax=Solwaraspora sp. WMMD1047 TaxID=3016102 RepID=UPI002416E4AE|nr:TIGR03086 family metal-binding protein [Solwaraspora sp. WMMD1047]MDG4833407.1 TIGR03086 family metal-binding protein [Solwaraspora sp. WMMD1047]